MSSAPDHAVGGTPEPDGLPDPDRSRTPGPGRATGPGRVPARPPGLVPDLLITAVLVAVAVGGTGSAATNQDTTAPWWAYPLAVGAALAVAVRRRWPYQVLAVAAVTTGGHLLLGGVYGPILLSLVVAVYTVAAHRPIRPALAAATAALVLLLAHLPARPGPDRWDPLLPMVAWLTVPFAVGFAVRVGRDSVTRSRHEQIRAAADAERLRVAQEVHDVVGHGLAAITMQAEVALHLLDRKPEQAHAALAAIARTSRESLDELKVTLGVVRGAERSPAPGLGGLDALVGRMRDVGLPVTVDVAGPPTGLPSTVDLAAYRVVQESLTNVLRHAGAGARAMVRLRYRPDAVLVEVTDTGAGGFDGRERGGDRDGDGGGGHGIVGMRERVTVLGGDFTAGPRPGGGFRVAATLPVPRRQEAT